MLQISRSETSLKRDYPAQVFHCEFFTIFQKTLFTEHLWMTAPADPPFQPNFYSLMALCSFFLHFFLDFLLIFAIMGVYSERFFYFLQ